MKANKPGVRKNQMFAHEKVPQNTLLGPSLLVSSSLAIGWGQEFRFASDQFAYRIVPSTQVTLPKSEPVMKKLGR